MAGFPAANIIYSQTVTAILPVDQRKVASPKKIMVRRRGLQNSAEHGQQAVSHPEIHNTLLPLGDEINWYPSIPLGDYSPVRVQNKNAMNLTRAG